MKISIVGSRGIPAKYGGFETFAEYLAVDLAEAGYEIVVYCEQQTGEECLTKYKGVKLKYLPRISLGPLTTIVHDFYALLREAFTNTKAVYLLGYGASIFGIITRIRGQKLIINMDGIEWQREKWNYFPARHFFKFMEWVSVRVASHLIADSASIKDFLVSRHPIPEKKITVIEYGADIESLSAANIPVAERFADPYFLVVGRIEPENNVREILSGFGKAGVQAKLKVVGNCHTNAYGRNLVEQFADNKNVEFLGAIYDQDALSKLRNGAIAHIHGHKVGGTNPSLLEAMASTALVLAHNNPHNCEVLGSAGWFFDNEDNLATQIHELLTISPGYGQQRVDETRARIRSYYSWHIINQKYRHYFEGFA